MNLYTLLAKAISEDTKLKIKRKLNCPEMRLTLRNLQAAGYSPKTIIDVGANDTSWSVWSQKIWPAAKFFLFEPNNEYAAVCKTFCQKGHVFFDSALCDYEGEAKFHHDGTNSSLEPDGEHTVRVTTLDTVLNGYEIAENSLLKIDVQGDDLRVVQGGANRVMPRVGVVIIEVSLILLSHRAPTVQEVLTYMQDTGFRLYDICSFWRRPVDDALWAVDMVFVRNELPYGDRDLGY